MNLNCKPGDLARVISTPETRMHGVEDWIVKVTVASSDFNAGRPAWCYEGATRCPPKGPFKGIGIEAFADDLLRPMRDPGDDAVDETLLRIPSPLEPVT